MTALDYRTKVPFFNCFSEAVVYFPDVIYVEFCTKSKQCDSHLIAKKKTKQEDYQCCHKGKRTQGEEPKGRKL